MNSQYRFTRLAVLLFLICALAWTMVVAQETTAGMQGQVKDKTGAAVAKASVNVTSSTLIGGRTVTTDNSGYYRISDIPPGAYTLVVTATGFRTYKSTGLVLQTGAMPTIDVALEVGAVSETVEVTGQAPIVDVTQSKVSVVVEQQELANMPKGRSYQSLIPFAPGARQDPLQGSRTDRNNAYQIDGASDGENVYMIDGVNSTQANVGGVGKNFQSDFVQEVQIKSSSFEAEYGGALGGVVNAVSKRGSSSWHGELKTYLQMSGMDANDACYSGYTSWQYSTVCGQRLLPGTALNSTTRLDGTLDYYHPAKDHRSVIEPGYEVGGPLFGKDRLWLFSSYIPSIDRTSRLTTFTGTNPGPRTLDYTQIQHNMYNRLDYKVFNQLRLFASWNYAYVRASGALGAPDSVIPGQVNTGASTNPATLRSDAGSANPLDLWSFGGDWTPTSKLVVTARYGYFFSNTDSHGVNAGTRYIYDAAATGNDLLGVPYPAGTVNTAGFSNFGTTNFGTHFDAFKRKMWNFDGSYFLGNAWGSHTLKAGYFWTGQSNDVLITANGNVVDLEWNQQYSPVTSTTACDTVKNGNTGVLHGVCAGEFGYFFVGSTQTSNFGGTTQTANAMYVQDAWTLGHGVTLNLGVRFDEEALPPYDPTRFPSIKFGWGDKIAPRLGGAWDVFRNGKVKVYASYGKFYDIMKMNLARGSFGSDYWHECVYAMDSASYTGITPTLTTLAGCPASGPAPGVTVGRFIENVDFRATKADPRDPAVDPNMKPMSQHEFVTGVDWAITPNWGLETRYSRKRLDKAIEDMAITDNLGFYIGNPGSKFADVLHRPVVIPDAGGNNYLTTVPMCAECPGVVPAIRRYDGVELRLTHRPTGKWYGFVSYTYSKLTGNYPGLTNTDPTDGNGGRHNPNNTRLFDIPTMTYLPNGKIDDGPLSTDRPNTGKAAGYYRLNWLGMVSNIGLIQTAYEGSPLSSCMPVVGTSSACQWAEGRGNWVRLSRDPVTHNIVSNGVVQNARTAPYTQTDMAFIHEMKVSKTHEAMRLMFEANFTNLFNQHTAVAFYEYMVGGANDLVNPTRAARFSGDPQTDWNMVMRPYNYIDALNGTGAFAGIQSTNLTLASRYGHPQNFQSARQLRLAARFRF